MLQSSSIDNASGSSSSGVLGVASAGASARPDGTGRTGVLASSSIDNGPGSSNVVLDGDFEEDDEACGHGAAVALGGALPSPDGITTAGAAEPVAHNKRSRRRRGRGKDLGKWQRKILGKNQDKSDDRSVNKSDDG